MKKISTILLTIIAATATFNVSLAQTSSSETEKTAIRAQALQMIALPDPTFKPLAAEQIDPQMLAEIGFEQIYKTRAVKFRMKDGKDVSANHFVRKNSRLTIILLHGVLSSAVQMNKTAGLLREAARAEVFAVNLRGHGQSDGKPGDVDYIDQYAEDLAQIIVRVKKDKPENKIVVAGHSMGGGISLRYAMLKDRVATDGFLLFAPLLGQNTPTYPEASAGGETNREPFLKIHIQRLIGLKMLNSIGEHKHDDLNVLFFNVPENAPVKTYTYRANESMSPTDYKEGLKAVREPLLVLVGSRDEAFNAKAFKDAVESNSAGEVSVVEGASHNGIRHDPQSMRLIREWLAAKIASQPRS